MRFPWEPEFERLMREKEANLRAADRRSGLEPQTVATPASAVRERPSGPAPFRCEFCGRSFLAYPRLLNHRCSDEGW